MADEKQVRKVARCVRTLLETSGHKLNVKTIVGLIEGSDLSDPVALSQKISQDIATAPETVTPASIKISKSQAIGDFYVQNYDVIRSNPIVNDGLLHLYSRGRLSKEDQEAKRAALIARAEGTEATEPEQIAVEPETTEEVDTSKFNF